MKNPFIYGEAVTGHDFCDRKAEIAKLTKDLLDSQKVFLIASRRIGKTSLLKSAMQEIQERGVKCVYVDIEGITTYKRFLEIYLNKITNEFSVGAKLLDFAKRILPGIRLLASIEEDRSTSLSLGYKPYDSDWEAIASKIYDLPSKIAAKGRFVVILDEFQEITKLNGGGIAAAMRASIQHQRNVGYVFAGSKRHLLLQMATSQDSPFYKIGPMMFLEKIANIEFKTFLKAKFHKSKVKISEEALDRITALAEGIPYYTQMLAHEAWDIAMGARKIIDVNDIDAAFRQTIKEYETYFKEMWSSMIHTKKQILQVIAREGGKNLLSKEVMDKNELKGASTIQKTLELLIKDGRIDKEDGQYYIDDVLFREWIKHNTV